MGHGGGRMPTAFERIFTVTFPGPRTTTQKWDSNHHHDETHAFAHRDRDLTIHLTLEGQADRPPASSISIAGTQPS